MPGSPFHGPVRYSALLLPFFVAFGNAQAQLQSSAAAPTPQIPLVFPLFVEDGDFTSTPILVNGSVVSTYADVALRGPDGKTIATQRVQFRPHSQVPVNIRALLDSGTAPNTRYGSIVITQDQSLVGTVIVGTVAITQLSSSIPHYIDEEPTRPGPSSSWVLHGVADQSDGSPLISITSLSSMPQHVTIDCIGADHSDTSKVTLAPDQTLLTPACGSAGQDADAHWYMENLPDTPRRAVGIALTSDGAAGSFAAFGLAPKTRPMADILAMSTSSIPPRRYRRRKCIRASQSVRRR